MESQTIQYETVIVPKTKLIGINIKEIWNYRDLIMLFVKRDFVSLYKQTILGPAWAVIQPLLTTVVFTFIFGNIAGLAADGVPSFVFYLSGTIVWTYFSTCLTSTANTFIGNSAILGKVYFPRLVMPISAVISKLISFGIQFVFLLIFIIYYYLHGDHVSPNYFVLFFPLLIFQLAALSLGFGVIISSLTTKYRDLAMLITFGIQLWMYATPIAYDMRIIPESLQKVIMLNPVTPIVLMFRYAFLGLGDAPWRYYAISWGITVVVLFFGIILFNKVEKTFMDTV